MAGFVNNVLFNPTLGGTTDWVVSTAVQGFNTPAGAGAVDGRTYKYRAESADRSQWEIGEGVYTVGTVTLSRVTVLLNSLGTTAKINFTVAPQVGIVALTEDILGLDQANNWTTTQKAQARANIDVSRFNYFMNGAMQISQENGTTAGTSNTYYPVDQTRISFVNAGAISVAQVASRSPAGSANRIRVTVTTADASVAASDLMHLNQSIEGQRVASLLFGTANAKPIVIQFGVKAPAGTYGVTVLNSAGNRSYVASYTITGPEANMDVVKSVTIPGDTSGTWLTDTGTGFIVRFGLMAGTTYQQAAGSWGTVNAVSHPAQFNFMGTLSNVFELFDVGLYEGTVAPAFAIPDFATELWACKRYFRRFLPSGAAIAQTTTTIIFMANHEGMRAAPAISAPVAMTISDIFAANFTQSSGVANINSNTPDWGTYTAANFTGLSATGRPYVFLGSSASMKLDARL